MLLGKRTDKGVTTYRYENNPANPPPSPEAQLGGQIRATQELVVYAERVEIGWTWCHTSGQAELYFDAKDDVITRAHDGWPASLAATITKRFGRMVAAEIESVLKDPNAFGSESAK